MKTKLQDLNIGQSVVAVFPLAQRDLGCAIFLADRLFLYYQLIASKLRALLQSVAQATSFLINPTVTEGTLQAANRKTLSGLRQHPSLLFSCQSISSQSGFKQHVLPWQAPCSSLNTDISFDRNL